MGEMLSMAHVLTWLCWVLAVAWIWQAATALPGMASLPDLTVVDPSALPLPDANEGHHLTVVVPARNEGRCIEATLRSLLASTGLRLQIIVIDDRSTDLTGHTMDSVAAETDALSGPHCLQVIHIDELPHGWLGKPHAMAVGMRQATAPWVLFTDGDVLFHPQALELALREVVALRADHLILVPTLILKSTGERAMLGAMQALAQWTIRPWKVADPRARDSIGVGGFNLLRREVYLRVGGFEGLRMEVLEDLYLGRRVKGAGFAQRVVIGPGLVRIRWIQGALSVVRLFEKNSFAVTRFRVPLHLLMCLALAIQAVIPLAGIAQGGWATAAGIATYVAIGLVYLANRRVAGVSPWLAVLFGPATAIVLFASLLSMVLALMRNGVDWRGTRYSLDELRRHASTRL
jgi:glycosyltransferase involved in cell wall biosynthesis